MNNPSIAIQTGHEEENEGLPGFYYAGARYYNSAVGIWYSGDPAGQGFTPYWYCGNNPMMYTDPTGAIFGIDDIFIAGFLIGSYIGGASAQNHWEWNPTKWENNFGTYLGVIGGGLAGGFAANAIAGMHGLMLTLNRAEWGTIGGSNTLLGNITSALGGGLLGIIPGKTGNELSQENGGTGNGSNKSDILSSDYPDAKYIEYIYGQGSIYEDPGTGIPVYNTYEVIQPGPFAQESYTQNTYFYTGEAYWYNGEPTPWVVDRLKGGLQDAGLLDPTIWISGRFALSGKIGQRTDWIRWGPTRVSNQLIQGPGAKGYEKVWSIKGGGINPKTGFNLPFHYHIHKYNWYKPWLWFKYTKIF